MLEENFEPVAQSRANYYTPNSPVQFVRVELLKGDQSGQNAVCLTFKNIAQVSITSLEIAFKCKGADGSVLCEDTFHYEDLNVAQGELFGMDEAVFVTEKPIGSVDVVLKRVFSGKRVADFSQTERKRLPAPKRLPAEMQAALEQRMGRGGLKFVPQVLEDGWYCACGAFHPNEENTVYCSECRSDRILLQNALNTIMQPTAPSVQPAPVKVDEPTRIADSTAAHTTATTHASTRQFDPVTSPEENDADMKVVNRNEPGGSARRYAENYRPEAEREPSAEQGEEDYEDPRDIMAENLIRWTPAVTALICAAIALSGFLYCQVIL